MFLIRRPVIEKQAEYNPISFFTSGKDSAFFHHLQTLETKAKESAVASAIVAPDACLVEQFMATREEIGKLPGEPCVIISNSRWLYLTPAQCLA